MALDRGRRRGVGVGLRPRREVIEQAAEVAPLGGLVVGCQPHQLADVREPGLAGTPHQDAEVVARLGHGDIDQLRQRQERGASA